ncbi:uncharacterized protein [Typha latifolia]|uniref:uncharacterized protein n=1 Tax=Typha latifolia TaxID=4733 RepID=UPI003C2AF97A
MRPVHHLLFLLALLPLATSSAALHPATDGAIRSVCGRTPNPSLCVTTVRRSAGKPNHDTVDARAVLYMQIRATVRRTKAAKIRAARLIRSSRPAVAAGLKLCSNLYVNMVDNLGAATRAGKFGDKALIGLMLSSALQNLVSCDYEFTKIGLKSPMTRFDASLTKMTNNCVAINNMT